MHGAAASRVLELPLWVIGRLLIARMRRSSPSNHVRDGRRCGGWWDELCRSLPDADAGTKTLAARGRNDRSTAWVKSARRSSVGGWKTTAGDMKLFLRDIYDHSRANEIAHRHRGRTLPELAPADLQGRGPGYNFTLYRNKQSYQPSPWATADIVVFLSFILSEPKRGEMSPAFKIIHPFISRQHKADAISSIKTLLCMMVLFPLSLSTMIDYNHWCRFSNGFARADILIGIEMTNVT
jgi:hypothetical protein